MICLINAEGLLIVETIWSKTADRRRGPRETRFETVSDAADLQRLLDELVPALAWQPPPFPLLEYGAAVSVAPQPAAQPAPAAAAKVKEMAP
jgi:hypothetical protein